MYQRAYNRRGWFFSHHSSAIWLGESWLLARGIPSSLGVPRQHPPSPYVCSCFAATYQKRQTLRGDCREVLIEWSEDAVMFSQLERFTVRCANTADAGVVWELPSISDDFNPCFVNSRHFRAKPCSLHRTTRLWMYSICCGAHLNLLVQCEKQRRRAGLGETLAYYLLTDILYCSRVCRKLWAISLYYYNGDTENEQSVELFTSNSITQKYPDTKYGVATTINNAAIIPL